MTVGRSFRRVEVFGTKKFMKKCLCECMEYTMSLQTHGKWVWNLDLKLIMF